MPSDFSKNVCSHVNRGLNNMLDNLTDSLDGFSLGSAKHQKVAESSSCLDEVTKQFSKCSVDTAITSVAPVDPFVVKSSTVVPQTSPMVTSSEAQETSPNLAAPEMSHSSPNLTSRVELQASPMVTQASPVAPQASPSGTPTPSVVPVVISLSDSESEADNENAAPKAPIPLIVISDSESDDSESESDDGDDNDESDDQDPNATDSEDNDRRNFKELVKAIFGSDCEGSDDESDSNDESGPDDDDEDEFFNTIHNYNADDTDDDVDVEMTNNIIEMIQTIRKEVDTNTKQDADYLTDDDDVENVMMRSQSPEIITKPGKFALGNEDSYYSTATVGYNVDMDSDWEMENQPNPYTASTSQQPKSSEINPSRFPMVKFEQTDLYMEQYEPPICSMSTESLASYESMMIDEPYYTRTECHDVKDIEPFSLTPSCAKGNIAVMDRGDFEDSKSTSLNPWLESLQSRPTTLFQHPEASKEFTTTMPTLSGIMSCDPMDNIHVKGFNTTGINTSPLFGNLPTKSQGNSVGTKDAIGQDTIPEKVHTDDPNTPNTTALTAEVNTDLKEKSSELQTESRVPKQPKVEILQETTRISRQANRILRPRDPRLRLTHKVSQKHTYAPVQESRKGLKRDLDDDDEENNIEPSTKKFRSNSWSQHTSKSFSEFCHQWMPVTSTKDVTTVTTPGSKRKYKHTVHDTVDGASPSKRSRL